MKEKTSTFEEISGDEHTLIKRRSFSFFKIWKCEVWSSLEYLQDDNAPFCSTIRCCLEGVLTIILTFRRFPFYHIWINPFHSGLNQWFHFAPVLMKVLLFRETQWTHKSKFSIWITFYLDNHYYSNSFC